jgi:hypothetical protein
VKQRVIPMPLADGKSSVEAMQNLRAAIEHAIQAEADDGWRFVGQVESVTFQNPGCLLALFGAKPVPIPVRFLVFERPQ